MHAFILSTVQAQKMFTSEVTSVWIRIDPRKRFDKSSLPPAETVPLAAGNRSQPQQHSSVPTHVAVRSGDPYIALPSVQPAARCRHQRQLQPSSSQAD
ncbi:unnamed protein product [Caenorhabditis brenneri]